MFPYSLIIKFIKNAIKKFLVNFKGIDEYKKPKNNRSYIKGVVVHIISIA